MPDIERVQQYSSVTDRIRPADHHSRPKQQHHKQEHLSDPEDVVELHEEEPAEVVSATEPAAPEEHLDLSA
ncbi:MAG: hypothetical protein U0R49_06930 [Fimbriimonadales bacterium]